jgi:hypothetical protein
MGMRFSKVLWEVVESDGFVELNRIEIASDEKIYSNTWVPPCSGYPLLTTCTERKHNRRPPHPLHHSQPEASSINHNTAPSGSELSSPCTELQKPKFDSLEM